MKDVVEAKICLGLEIHRYRSIRQLKLSQSQYVNVFLDHFSTSDSLPVNTQMEHANGLDPLLGDDDGKWEYTSFLYPEAIGIFTYLMISILPDI